MRMRPCSTFVFIYALLCGLANAGSADEAPPFDSPSLNPRAPDVDPNLPFVETVTRTDFAQITTTHTYTFTLSPSVGTYTAGYIYTFLDEVFTANDFFYLTAPESEQTPTALTIPTQSSNLTIPTQSSSLTISTQSSSQIMSSSPPPSSGSGKRVHVPVIGVVGALLALGAFVLLFYVLRRRAKRRNGGHLPLDEEMALGPAPSDEKGAQVVAVPHGPATSKGSGRGGDVGSVQAERDPSLLAEQVRVLKAQLQATLQAQGSAADSVARTASTATDTGPSVTRPLSTTKRTWPLTVRNYEPAPLLVHTDSGIRLEPAQTVEELPPMYVPRKSFVGQSVL
ncbi:hypothetical protein B0H13DRAFT_1992360 [Mycena leptocephala]|nr:hypothetical protein B0H13DRAFT_1992360 [Mycena leptocephala]